MAKGTFEQRLTELETLVRTMETGGLDLKGTLDAYEKGMRLAKDLTRDLDAAEKKMLVLKDGKPEPMEDAP